MDYSLSIKYGSKKVMNHSNVLIHSLITVLSLVNNISQRDFPINPKVVQLQYTIKKPAGPGKDGYKSCIRLWPIVEHAKKFFLASHTTSTAQSGE